MKETSFIEQNKDKWQRFEALRKDKNANPDELSSLFVEITDDLSYARTFYPRRSVRVYLNNLAQSVFNSLYKLKKDPFGNFFRFWKIGLPLEMYHARKYFFAAFLFFIIALLIGIVSTLDDISFADVMLSPEYTNMTEQNIENGDPMAVYKQTDELPMFVFIFLNNIQVSFLCFAMGILFCAGTGYFLLYNGVMVGAFQTFFYVKGQILGGGIFLTSVLTIWIHGAFEISSIILSGAAGFVIGMHLLYPGTYSRIQSFQIGAKRGLKMMMGVTLFLFIAAILESYVTRHTEMSVTVKVAIISLSMLIFITYFVLYPFYIHSKYGKQYDTAPKPVYRPSRKLEFYKLKQVNEMVADTFILFKQVYQRINKAVWFLIIPLNISLLFFMFNENIIDMSFYDILSLDVIVSLFSLEGDHLLYFLVTVLLISFTSALTIQQVRNIEGSEKGSKGLKSLGLTFLKALIFYPFLLACLSLLNLNFGLAFFISVIAFPLFLYMPIGITGTKAKGFERISETIRTFFTTVGNAILLFLVSLLVLGGFFILIHSMVYYVFESILEWHLITTTGNFEMFVNILHTSIYVIFFHHLFMFLVMAYAVYHYVNIETRESISLFNRLKKFGSESKTHERFIKDEE